MKSRRRIKHWINGYARRYFTTPTLRIDPCPSTLAPCEAPMSFFPDGPCGDPGYLNTRDRPCGIDHKRLVEAHWVELEKKGLLPKGKG